MNRLRTWLRNWLLLDTTTLDGKTSVEFGGSLGELAKLVALHQEWLDVLDERVNAEAQYTTARFENLGQLMTLFQVRDIPKPEGFDERMAALAGIKTENEAEEVTS